MEFNADHIFVRTHFEGYLVPEDLINVQVPVQLLVLVSDDVVKQNTERALGTMATIEDDGKRLDDGHLACISSTGDSVR